MSESVGKLTPGGHRPAGRRRRGHRVAGPERLPERGDYQRASLSNEQALGLRRLLPALGAGTGRDVRWLDLGEDVLGFSREPGFVCVVNTGAAPVPLPDGRVVLRRDYAYGDQLAPDTAAWLTT